MVMIPYISFSRDRNAHSFFLWPQLCRQRKILTYPHPNESSQAETEYKVSIAYTNSQIRRIQKKWAGFLVSCAPKADSCKKNTRIRLEMALGCVHSNPDILETA